MKRTTSPNVYSLFLTALVILSLALTSFKPESAPPPLESKPGRQVILRAKPEDVFFRLSPPAQTGLLKTPTANITVNYIGPWDPSAQAAFQYAVDIWASLIVSPALIKIEAEWSSLAPDILGGAGPTDLYRNFPNAPQTNVWYPAALADAIAGSNLNGSDPEITATFNQSFPSWYFGVDGNPPPGKYDFVSVVLHEIGHGLGFSGTAEVDNNSGLGSWGFGSPYPDVYDLAAENLSGQKIIDFPNPSTELADQLRKEEEGLFFNGPNAEAANNGNRPELYAPGDWLPGSSYSHLDETVYDQTAHALMTPFIGSAEATHDPGPITLGIFQDLGWAVNIPPTTMPDLTVSQQLQNPALAPGSPVSIILSIENKGDATATQVVLTNILPTGIVTPSWTSSASLAGISLQDNTTYIWDLPDLAAGAAGTITINGALDANLPDDFALVNTATISTAAEETTVANNAAVIILGGKRVYLPLIYH